MTRGYAGFVPYPKKLLNDYETLALDMHPHWWFFAESVFSLIVTIGLGVAAVVMDAPSWLKWFVLLLIVLAVLWVFVTYLKWITTNFVITSDRVIFRHGIFAKSGIEMPLERVNSVHFDQGVWERIVGAGDLLIESGAKEGQQRFTDIRNPDRVQNLIHAQMEQNEDRMYGNVRQRNAAAAQMPPPPPNTAAGGGPPPDVVTQLEKLEAMRDRGTLSAEDFEAQKRRLLDG